MVLESALKSQKHLDSLEKVKGVAIDLNELFNTRFTTYLHFPKLSRKKQ